MARAKRTTRAEARRRYRAEHGLLDDTNLDEESAEADAPAARQGASRTAPDGTGRIGIFSAVRLAFRPLDAPGDFRALPRLVTHKALWLPVLLTIGAAVLTGISQGADVLSQFAFQYFVVTPAIGGVFIAGFLAPRASWLLGVIVGLVSAVCYTILGYRRAPACGLCGGVRPRAVRGHRLVIRLLADHGRAVRIRGGVVPPVPAAVEPEPRKEQAAGAAWQRRPEPFDVRAEGERAPLTPALTPR